MQKEAFYEHYVTRGGAVSFTEDRLGRVLRRVPRTCTALIDVGSGNGRNLEFLRGALPNARLCGVEIAASGVENIRRLGFEAEQCDASVEIPYGDATFDVALCGEIIEHVVQTDRLLQEIKRVLKPGGTLILTTPNLAYAVNRVLLLFGIQPLFTETSYHTNLGRVFGFLGQGKPTQGHLKVFTTRSLRELLELSGFDVVGIEGYSIMLPGVAGKIDSILRRFPSIAGGVVVEGRARP